MMSDVVCIKRACSGRVKTMMHLISPGNCPTGGETSRYSVLCGADQCEVERHRISHAWPTYTARDVIVIF